MGAILEAAGATYSNGNFKLITFIVTIINSQLLISQSRSSSQTTGISEKIFGSKKINLEIRSSLR